MRLQEAASILCTASHTPVNLEICLIGRLNRLFYSIPTQDGEMRQTCHEATNQPAENMFRRYDFPLSATIERCLSKAAAMAFRRPSSLMPNGRSAADSEACLGTIFFKYPGILAASRTACIPVLARTFYDWMPTRACHGEVHASKARTGHMLLLCFAWRTRYLHLPTSTTILH